MNRCAFILGGFSARGVFALVSLAVLSVGSAQAAAPVRFNPDTDWMAGKIGIFQHRLYGACPGALRAMKHIDPKAMAEQLADIGADYFCITLNQCGASFLAPNDVYEDMCGYRRGEICNQRDIPMELADALAAKGIRFMLYATGTPPREDRKGSAAVGYRVKAEGQDPQFTPEGMARWAKVLEFWSRRYGTKVCGWWMDGCDRDAGFDSPGQSSEIFARALKAGNPHAVVTFNGGLRLEPFYEYEDYISGECNEPFLETCNGRWLGGRQWQMLTYTYSPLGFPAEVSQTDGEWIVWLRRVVANGGCVTIDAHSKGNGCLLKEPAAQLKRVLAAVRGRLDPNGADARKIAAENAIRARTDAVEASRHALEYGQRKFFRVGYAYEQAAPDRHLVRKGPNGEEIWSDAIQAALDRYGAVRVPTRGEPFYLDRPIVLKSGQSIWMGERLMPFRPRLRSVFRALPGVKGPLVTNASSGDRDIYIRGVFFEGVDNPMRFAGVTGLVVRDLALFGCMGVGLTLADVRDFRVDAVSFRKSADPAFGRQVDVGVKVGADCRDGLVRNVAGFDAWPTPTDVKGENVWCD